MKILKVRDVKTPNRANKTDAGIDFYVPNDFKEIFVYPGEDILIPSGIKAAIPNGYALVANNKSGVATKKKLICGAAVVDESYQGEIHIHLINFGKYPVKISPGEKIIQFLLEKQEYCSIEEVSSEDELYGGLITTRGEGGFGSTGIN